MKHKLLTSVCVLLSGLIAVSCSGTELKNENGHNLWFHSMSAGEPQILSENKTTLAIADNEIMHYWKGSQTVTCVIPFGEKDTSIAKLGNDGYCIDFDKKSIVISAATETGVLYGVYDLLRRQETGNVPKKGRITEIPAYDVRILNHWDNPNLTVERGFAGNSLWKWEELPNIVRPEYEEYARANASIGINATVLNNVNADPCMLTAEYLQKVKVLADIFRPYGIKVYLSLNFAAPKHLAGLDTSDPLNQDVISFWNEKVAEIYSIIPDFGGFLVKANSEGQSGPQDYGRTHADGANMIADALKPYGGIVMWRAFVYAATAEDRAMQAADEFMPLDGQFRDNVIIQIKNGPIDFQPREPFSPLFGLMDRTKMMVEVQVTQEYLGHSNHLVYLHPMWKECLDSDTYMKDEGSTVAAITEGKFHNYSVSAIAGVANIGDSVNWCGHHFAQANWYAFGRMAWNPELTSEQIADEWIRMTFTDNPKFLNPVKEMMLASRENTVHYEMPMGIHHAFAGAGHYGPGPWEQSMRRDWSPTFYHKAAADGIGFDRTMEGSGAVAQYHEPLKSLYENVETCPEELILWFHHLPWDYQMKGGETLWETLCHTYQSGIDAAASYITTWESVSKYVDSWRYSQVYDKLVRQAKDAIWWRDACIGYFQTFSGMELPSDCTPIQHPIDELRRFRLRISNYETPALDALPEYELPARIK